MKTLNMQTLTVSLYRYYPPLCATMSMLHVISLILGYSTSVYEFIIDSSLVTAVMQWVLSKAFRFCTWHRLCIIYTYIISLCIDYQRTVGFGDMRTPMRWIVLSSGLTILIGFTLRCRQHEVQNNIFAK